VGVFEFIIVLVLISTAGKIISNRRSHRDPQGELPKGGRAELERIRDTVDDLGGRLMRLEEERDFYKELLDSPGKRGVISSPDMEEDASEDPGSIA
jgi:hypothetical protein